MKITDLSEKGLIAEIKKDFLSSSTGDLELGIGDDAAALKIGNKYLTFTKDLLIEDFHFIGRSHPPDLLGRKSLNVNLSDLAAMGSTPKYTLLGLGLPDSVAPNWVQDFFAGIKAAADKYKVELIGGDITRAEKITISLTLIGESRKLIKRSSARPGHLLYVSGTLGDSAQGLQLAQQGISLGQDEDTDFLLQAFLAPEPQVLLGMELAKHSLAAAMIDISDGLSIDLGHICEDSRVGAEIYAVKIPLSSSLCSLRKDPLIPALHGGEDYQLLFTVPQEKEQQINISMQHFMISQIGRITSDQGVFLIDASGNRTQLEARGFQHF